MINIYDNRHMASDVKKEIFKQFTQAAIKTGAEMSPYLIVNMLYKKIFDHRTISDPIKRFEDDDFPLLRKKKATFKSGDNLLTGYFFNYEKYDNSKIIIFAHGYGNGFHRYLEVIDYLAKQGFYVFSYDATSFDESEGEGINGFPQGAVDLAHAIKFIKENRGYKDKDIILFGHSWGAYSVGAVINAYPHISKAIAISGFNYAVDLIRQHGTQWIGDMINEQIPIMKEHEIEKFGEYGKYTVIDGIRKSTTKYFFIHSQDDETVPIEIGLKLYRKEFKADSRIKYKVFKDRGHICYNTKEGNAYFEELKAQYNKYLKGRENMDFEDRKHLLDLIIDKNKYLNMLDTSLMKEIVEFIKK